MCDETQKEQDYERRINEVYRERDLILSLLAHIAYDCGYPVCMGIHPYDDPEWEEEWRNIVFIQLPTGQASWHIREDELKYFRAIPCIPAVKWDGHSTEEKYERIKKFSRNQIHMRGTAWKTN